tara:strand:+ start:1477 stop:2328 length:852 start_codon:yes stop_codon:yes gene_type:complete
MKNKYTIYIPTRGRFDSRLTMKALDKIGIEYKIVIEETELKQYLTILPREQILVLPFIDKGLVGSRNWIKEYSTKKGENRHWQMDDNIDGFVRLNRNQKIRVSTGATIRACEDFSDRYKNVAFSGMNYRFFAAQRNGRKPPYTLNTRIYSCTLINNEIPHYYRAVYNDDTDISLRALKDGWCTILFNAFLCNKAATMTVKGGLNTEEFYQGTDNRREFVDSLINQHPDIVRKVWRYDRWHHEVDYRQFKNNILIRIDNYDKIVKKGVNNYGMKLIKIETNETV